MNQLKILVAADWDATYLNQSLTVTAKNQHGIYVVRCAIRYHLYNLKNVKNTYFSV